MEPSPAQGIVDRLLAFSVHIAARCYCLLLWERWGRNGRPCWEAQEGLARQLGVSERTIRRWEDAIGAAGVWTVSYLDRRRTLTFIAPEHRTPVSGIPSPASGQPGPVAADIADHTPDTEGPNTGPACPPTTRTQGKPKGRQGGCCCAGKSSRVRIGAGGPVALALAEAGSSASRSPASTQ
jgi:hypothetical protein